MRPPLPVPILEVGPNGPGLFRCFQNSDISLTTLDITDAHAGEKKEYPEINFITYDGEKMPFPSDAFEIVLCIDVLEHIPPEKRNHFLGELFRVSRKTIFLSFPVSTSRAPEKVLQKIFFNRFSFLREHENFGLPELSEIHSLVEKNTDWKRVKTEGTINRWLWIPVKLFSSLLHQILKKKKQGIRRTFSLHQKSLGKLLRFGTCYSYTLLLEKK